MACHMLLACLATILPSAVLAGTPSSFPMFPAFPASAPPAPAYAAPSTTAPAAPAWLPTVQVPHINLAPIEKWDGSNPAFNPQLLLLLCEGRAKRALSCTPQAASDLLLVALGAYHEAEVLRG
jgi:hypothetical protein